MPMRRRDNQGMAIYELVKELMDMFFKQGENKADDGEKAQTENRK